MPINFDSLPSTKPNTTIPAGRYGAIIETAEMKQGADPNKPPYLNLRYGILDNTGNRLGAIFDIISESESSLVRYKLQRFITALALPLTTFELSDLTKIVVGKKLEVDLKVEQNEGYAPRTVVDALSNEIYYPYSDNPFVDNSTENFNATDSADTTTPSDEY